MAQRVVSVLLPIMFMYPISVPCLTGCSQPSFISLCYLMCLAPRVLVNPASYRFILLVGTVIIRLLSAHDCYLHISSVSLYAGFLVDVL